MKWVNNLNEFFEFISYVLAYAPDDFPEEDFLNLAQQMTLSKSFEELFRGLDMLSKSFEGHGEFVRLKILLQDSLLAYEEGKENLGASLLQDFEEIANQIVQKGDKIQ